MKKLLAVMMIASMFGFAACSGGEKPAEETGTAVESAATEAAEAAATETPETASATADSTATPATEPAAATESGENH